jgi:hypothetical protein
MTPRNGHGEKLSRNAERVIAALLTEPTLSDAAKASGVSESSIGRWLKDDAFSRAYYDARRAALSAAVARLHGATSTRATS